MFLSGSFFVDCAVTVATLLVGVIAYYKWCFTYWQKRNIPFVEPSIPFGTLSNPLGKPKSTHELSVEYYKKYKSLWHKHVGGFFLMTPLYLPIDVGIIKNILTKDFDHFMDRGTYINERDDPLTAHLFSLAGTRWKNLRAKLTPTFTSGKMKMMFPIMVGCVKQLDELMSELASKETTIEIKDVLSRFTTDVIGSCAFGIDCNSCKDPSSEFRKQGKRIFVATKPRMLKLILGFAAPDLARFLRVAIIDPDTHDFFMGTITNTVSYREKNNVTRKDFLQLLMDMKNSESGGGLTMNELAAQALVFFLAGYETSSSAMSFALYELSQNQEIQQRARNEINAVLEKHGEISYEAIHDMKYLGQVLEETLRKYPALGNLNRICVKNYKVPGTDLVIEKGTPVWIPVLALQTDEEFFPNPDVFDPERFSEENKHRIKPFTYMPFGDGPRICIGLRFGVMQTKLGLATLLKNYRFSLNHKTEIPLEIDPFSFTLSARNDILLDVEKI